MTTIEILRSSIHSSIREYEPLAPYTSFKIGGPARFFYEPTTTDDAVHALTEASRLGQSVYVLGGGSNIVVSDEGIPALVIRMRNNDIRIDGLRVIAGAGAASGSVSKIATESGLTGLEWMIGLPGTVGGAVRGNAGMFGGEVCDTLESAIVWRNGLVHTMQKRDFEFSYRASILKRELGMTVLSATFLLREGLDSTSSKRQLVEYLLRKKACQPIEYPTAGCVFVNWMPTSPDDVLALREYLDLGSGDVIPQATTGAIPSAWILDTLGLKGLSVGTIRVSEKHANFFIHDGKGRAEDVIALIALLKTRVRNATHGIVNLHEEVEYVGFGG